MQQSTTPAPTGQVCIAINMGRAYNAGMGSTNRWWCSLCDRTYTRDGDDNICPYCKGRGQGAHWVQIKSKAFRRARILSGMSLERFRLTHGRDGTEAAAEFGRGAGNDYWAPERRGSGYVGVWFPITDDECNEAIETATFLQVIGGRLVAFFGRGWQKTDYQWASMTAKGVLLEREKRYQCLYDAARS